jgi:VanZ family protein
LFSVFEEYTQSFVEGREADIKDVLISIMAVLLTSIVVYSMPVIGELEMAVKHRVEARFGKSKK